MITSVEKILKLVDALAPFEAAESWDNVGLIIGKAATPVHRVLTCLDITQAVVDEAISEGFDLIVSHHPLIFSPVQRIVDISWQQRLILQLIENGISVIAAHTNVDAAFENGINMQLAALLGLENIRRLSPEHAFGLVGTIDHAPKLSTWIEEVKTVFNLVQIKACNVLDRSVRTVALSSGASADFIGDALEQGADVYITGDLRYHEAQAVQGTSMALLDIGHYESECIFSAYVSKALQRACEEKDYEVYCAPSQREIPLFSYF